MDPVSTLVVPLHLGSLHPFESVVLGLVAFGPFVVVALVVARQRRQADQEQDPEA